ncbi:MAG: MFS transporter, partial [Acidothermaceae bacterium]
MGDGARRVFSSLAIRNYRIYFTGQVISRIGTWMQRFAQSWLVYDLSHNATIVGVVVALQALPTLVAGPYGGLVADRFDKRRIMIVLQSTMGLLALVLGLLTVTHVVRLWEIFVLALLLGISESFENPARQVFVFEMVGAEQLPNAVGLNSVLNNIARTAGPAIGAGLVATVGLGACFLVNAASFGAVVTSLLVIDVAKLRPVSLTRRARGQLREGVAYVRGLPALWVPLVMMTLVGTFAWEFQTVLPPMASQVLHGGATAYGLMTAAQGVGAVVGGLLVAGLRRTGIKILAVEAVAFGGAMTLVSLAPNLATGIALM